MCSSKILLYAQSESGAGSGSIGGNGRPVLPYATVEGEIGYSHGRRSRGDAGTSPHRIWSRGGASENCPPQICVI